MLLSFPGSGNTWMRLLTEYATGYYTGSVDVNDKELMLRMPGESVCDPRVVFVKGHPSDLKFQPNCAAGAAAARTGRGSARTPAGAGSSTGAGNVTRPGCLYCTERHQAKKCRLGGITTFDRFIYIVRDPYTAMLADFQRHITGSHVGAVSAGSRHQASEEEDNEEEDDEEAKKEDIQGLSQKAIQRPFNSSQFDEYIDQQTLGYQHKYATVITPLLRSLTPNELLVIRFEDLLLPDKRHQIMEGVVRFLHLPVDNDRLKCAFSMAERPELAHRTHKLNQTFAHAHLSPAFKQTIQTRLEAHLRFIATLRSTPRPP